MTGRSVRNRRWPGVAALAVLATSSLGCGLMIPVPATLVAVESVEAWPEQPMAYSENLRKVGRPFRSERGPWAAVYVSSQADLAAWCRRLELNHLYAIAFGCRTPDPYHEDFWGDDLFDVPVEDRERLHAPAGAHLYRFYIPIDLTRPFEQSIVTLHDETEVERVRQRVRRNGLCFLVGAGNMLGLGINSNTLRLKVKAEGDRLAIVPETDEPAGAAR